MKETIKAIINYLDTQNGGDVFIGDCGKEYDAPHCQGGCIPLVKCQVCQRRHTVYKVNKDYLDHVKELYEKETK
jgi:hypothetical protein